MPSKTGAPLSIATKWQIAFQQIAALVEADLRKLRHDPSELISRMIQPTIWLLLFGQAMMSARLIHTEESSYLNYLAPGILAQSILFTSIFYGISLIWERDMGILHKYLVSPVPRYILVVARGLTAGIRTFPQIIVVYTLCYFLGVDIQWKLSSFILVLAMGMVGAATFSTFSLIIAAIVKKRERFMGLGQVLTMPLFFASNALYPITSMPMWMQNFSHLNPLTYQVDALRHLMIVGEATHYSLMMDFGIGFAVVACLTMIAAVLYPKIIY